jgi:hypothetical protein
MEIGGFPRKSVFPKELYVKYSAVKSCGVAKRGKSAELRGIAAG